MRQPSSRDRNTKKPQHDSKRKTPDYLQKLELELEIRSERQRRQNAELQTREHARNYNELHEICTEYETKIAEAEGRARQKETEAGHLRRMLNEETKRADLNDWYIQKAEDVILDLEKAALAQRERATDTIKELQLRIQYGEGKTKQLRELIDEVSAEVKRCKNQTTKDGKDWIDFYNQLLEYSTNFEQRRAEILQKTQKMQDMIGLSEEGIQNRARLLQNEGVELDAQRSAVDTQIKWRKTVNDLGLVAGHVTKHQKRKNLAVTEREKEGKRRENMERAQVNLWKDSRNNCTFWTDDDSLCSSPDSFNATIESAYDFQLPDPARRLPADMSHAFNVPWASQRMDGVFYPPWPNFSPPISRMESLDLSDSDPELLTPALGDRIMSSMSDAAGVPQFITTAGPQLVQRKRVRFASPDRTGLGGVNEIERSSLLERSGSNADLHPRHDLDLAGPNPQRHAARRPSLNRRPGKPVIHRHPCRLPPTSAPQIEHSQPTEPPLPHEVTPPMEPSPRWPESIGHQYLEGSSSHSARSRVGMVAALPLRTTSPVQQTRGVQKTNKKSSSSSRQVEKARRRWRDKVPKSPTLPMPMPGMWPGESPLDDKSKSTTKPHFLGPLSESVRGRLRRIIQRRRYQLAGGLVIFGTLLYAFVGHHSHHKWLVYNGVPQVILSKLRNSPTTVISGSTSLDFNVMNIVNYDRAKLG